MTGMLGARIKRLRLDRDLSQEQLAVKAGLVSATIRRLERGQIPEVKLPTLEAVARALGVSLAELLTDDDDNGAPAAAAGTAT